MASADADVEAVLRLHGDIDFFTEDEFRAQAERDLATPGLARLVVDLADVTSLDSSGLGLLMDLRGVCRDAGVMIVLRSVPDQVRRLLDTAEMPGPTGPAGPTGPTRLTDADEGLAGTGDSSG